MIKERNTCFYFLLSHVLLGTASLVLKTGISIEEIKAMTPLVMVYEHKQKDMIFNAARTAKEKMDIIQS